jgi:thiol-disulfide isomerase/thioredoxin
LPLGSIPARLTALLLGVSLVGGAEPLAVAEKGDNSPAPTPKNAVQKPDPGRHDTAQHDSRQHEVRLHFRLPAGMTFPADFRPEVYAENDRDQARLMWQPENRRSGARNSSLLPVQAVGSGQFEVRLPHPEQPFYVAIHVPGLLRFFERGPFHRSKIKDGQLEIEVPKPATLEVRFDPGQDKPEDRPFDGQRLNLFRHLEGTRNSYLPAGQDLPFDGFARITDLAAGDYRVRVNTNQKPKVQDVPGTKWPSANPGEYGDWRQVTLAPGQSQRINFKYKPFDINVFRGHRTAILRFLKPDRKPAADRKVWVGYFDGHYGTVPVYSGPTSPSGGVTLENITDRVPNNMVISPTPFSVFVGERLVRYFGLESKAPVETFTILMAPDVGDPAPDADLIQVSSGKHIKLSSLRGKLVCIDFWATWCGPCQPAIKNLDSLSANMRDSWKGRVAFVPLSIDEKPELVTRHLAKNKWTHLEHFWAGPNEISFDAPAAKLFVVDGVPTSFLIAPDGRILWRGEPLAKVGGKTLADRIEEALKP